MYQVTNYKQLSIGNYILWIAAEIVSLAIVYVVLQYFFISPPNDLLDAFKESLKITMLVLLLPYTISYLYLSWMEKNKKLEELSSSREAELPQAPLHIPFKDEKGELKFSLKSADLLYLEAADNYVKIYYMDGRKIQHFMIRNSLKSFEADLADWGIIRCHRSYMVNFSRVKIVRKEKDGLVLEIDGFDNLSLPISDSYVKEVMKAFSVGAGVK